MLMITGGTNSIGNVVLKRFLRTDIREIIGLILLESEGAIGVNWSLILCCLKLL